MNAQIFVIGNEILDGDVKDVNSSWLSEQITGLGGIVKEITILRDDLDVICRKVITSIKDRPSLLLIAGGLGPTIDDCTLEAVARATNCAIVQNQEAVDMVRSKYEELHLKGFVKSSQLTDARLKMGLVPLGSELLKNPVGVAPGVLIRLDSTMIVCLPGVPEEMRAIFTVSLVPVLDKLLGNRKILNTEVITNINDESFLAPILQDISFSHPDVYIKSRVRRFGTDENILITLSSRGQERTQVENKLYAAVESLRARIPIKKK